MLVKPLLRRASPQGADARLSILIFHRVLPQVDALFPDEVDARRFNQICGWVKQWFNVLPLDAAVAHLQSSTLPERAACITFDDGYADNFHVALPILKAHGLSSTFFIATGFLDGGRMWNDTIVESVRACRLPQLDLQEMGLGVLKVASVADKQAAISALIGQIKYRSIDGRVSITRDIALQARVQPPANLMMTSNEVKLMHQSGMQIGAHTVNHPILARLSQEEARCEILESRKTLERILGEQVGLFAYPNGKPSEDYSPETAALVRDLGFDAAVSTRWGVSSGDVDLFELRRFTPWDRSQLRFAARMMTNMWAN